MVADLRKEYTQAGLSETEVRDTPMAQFGVWFQQALDANIHEPNRSGTTPLDGARRSRCQARGLWIGAGSIITSLLFQGPRK